MPLFSTGINHTTASVDIRERLAFTSEELPAAVQRLGELPAVDEAVIVSTCNRTELYAVADDVDRLVQWFSHERNIPETELRNVIYSHAGESAIRHLLRVTAGLDSMVVGEPQILGQVKLAYQTALGASTTKALLNRLFEHSFSAAKRVRTETQIGAHPVSVASAAVDLARQIFADLSEHTALLIGAGQTIEICARHLSQQQLRRIVIANRNATRAQALAREIRGFGIGLDEIDAHLAEADILIASTGSTHPIVQLDHVKTALKARKHRPILMVDLAVPRDIDPRVAKLDDVYLYTVDDLRQVIQNNLDSRLSEAQVAESIIDQEVRRFLDWLQGRDADRVLGALHGQAELARDESLRRALARLRAGVPAEQVVESLAHNLTNRLLHQPSVRLRQAGQEKDQDLLNAALKLFQLPTRED
ncbi:MAG: glutamyl-tRNA reductase [Pseudomonadota bacterium]|nr:glutamyl-tRNA reductase [Pseudomonadota bacterium]